MADMFQTVLDFFGERPAEGAAPGLEFIENRPPAQVLPGQAAIQKIASELQEPQAKAEQPVLVPTLALATHPQASRRVRLGDHDIGYAFARARRRTIGFSVGLDGLSVRAPRWTPLTEVDAALRDKSVWILRKLADMGERRQHQQAHRIDWAAQAAVLLDWRGQPLHVERVLAATARRASAVLLDDTPPGQPAVLQVALPAGAGDGALRDAVQAWLMRDARALFAERLDHFAPRLGVHWRKLGLSNAATRWGSASADGSIRLHWRLVHFDLSVIDYVVAHELSHLRFMDHSAQFWSTVGSVVPDYPALRQALKRTPIPRWD